MCKQGPFAQSLVDVGVRVLATTYESTDLCVEEVMRSASFDLVHAHPFASRKVGLEVARQQQIPFLLTFHGTYLDSLSSYGEHVDFIIAVSNAIRDYLSNIKCFPVERIMTIPNGVDTNLFHPKELGWDKLAQHFRVLADVSRRKEDRRILFVSRLDEDKQFVLDIVRETWANIMQSKAFDLTWLIAGDGTLRSEMEVAATKINRSAERKLIIFLGWQNEPSLARLYSACHLTIASGRSVMESMACGTPVIAIGSKGYVGLVDSEFAMKGVYGNFGGFGSKRDYYEADSMFHDIDRVIYNENDLVNLGRLSMEMINVFFNQTDLDTKLLRLYNLCCTLVPRGLHMKSEWVDLSYQALSFFNAEKLGFLSPAWAYPKSDKRLKLSVSETGHLTVDCRISQEDKLYISNDSTNFSIPPANTGLWHAEPDSLYEISTTAHFFQQTLNAQLWVIEYTQRERITHSNLILKEGSNKLEFNTSPQTSCFKIAFRFSGEGTVKLRPICIRKYEWTEKVSDLTANSLQRSISLLDFHDYQGGNLIFIMGPPRSGTTWVLNLLSKHPDVIAATEENLDAKMNVATTLETNIFNKNRPFTDNQIKRKFYLLSQRHPGKIIVEKTPVHLFYVDRMRRVFPKAALILTERDGRDVVTSLVNVGRDPNAWWMWAPKTVERATNLWKEYAEAAFRCVELHRPYVIRYERLLENPHEELAHLLTALGLSHNHIERQIELCCEGKNIPIHGVFREGKSGTWRRQFTETDVQTFKKIAAHLLVRLGYEKDDSWGFS